MRKLIITYVLSLCMSLAWAADVRDLFVAMPDSVLPMLSSINRLDMLDFHDSGMKAVVRNRLDGDSELTYLSRRSIRIRYTGSSEVDIRLFHYRDSVPLICVVHTVESGGLRDSRIRFYDSGWNRLDGSRILQTPSFESFIRSDLSRDSVAYIRRMSDINSVRVRVPDDSDRVEFEFTGLLYSSEDSLKCVSCLRKEPLIYDWNGRRFTQRRK